MQIAIITIGGRGDVQPYVALGVGLKQAGHSVTLVANVEFADLARSYALDFCPLHVDIQGAMQGKQGQDLNRSGQNPMAFMAEVTKLLGPMFVQGTREAQAACAAADVLVCSPTGFFIGYSLAEKFKRHLCLAYVFPATATQAFPHTLYTGRLPLGGWGNWLSYVLMDALSWQLLRSAFNLARQEVLDLPPLPWHWSLTAGRRLRHPLVYGYSPTLLPKPADWGAWVHVTGYWFLGEPPAWSPPPGLVDFLQAGPPPVYVGFGSMNEKDPAAISQLVVEAVTQAGQRAVLGMGWGGLGQVSNLPASVFAVESIPHSWLFPQMAAVVHHGGAGTTSAGLRAGKPTVIVPFLGDQFFWGRLLQREGLAPPPVLRAQLTAARLGAAITQATQDPNLRQRAAAMGERIRAENGVARTAAIFNELFV